MNFFFISLIMACCVYSLESLLCESNENVEHTFMLRKIEKISLLCLLTWHYDYRVTLISSNFNVSNKFSWFLKFLSIKVCMTVFSLASFHVLDFLKKTHTHTHTHKTRLRFPRVGSFRNSKASAADPQSHKALCEH